MAMRFEFSLTPKQLQFLQSDADEVLFGGAAGGGKSFAQMLDAFVYAMKYPRSKQLLLRRSRPELERTLVRTALMLYPRELYSYSGSSHRGQFANGSVLEFGYLASAADLAQYQSAEYDLIRFDELTHFTEREYLYMHSRLRGANGYPKQIKSCTNPGGIGHAWVKARFIDSMPPDTPTQFSEGSRIFLPARVQDNCFLMQGDPGYLRRLQALPARERKALLDGSWQLVDGRFFAEFSRDVHVTRPIPLGADVRRFIALDYGLDRLAALWFAVTEDGQIYCTDELCESGLVISQAAERILARNGELPICAAFAPADLWNRRQETGRSAADLFAEGGLALTKVRAPRIGGWLALKELLLPVADGQGAAAARLRVFEGCCELIRCLEDIGCDPHDPRDAATVPHALTHAPDAARYFAVGFADGALPQLPEAEDTLQELFRYGT
ncbi:MAG: phage terminase large subunit [Oscillospiraceae bacterium]|nr:phage terminase large subunit [Oscillospiraceae bacterium]